MANRWSHPHGKTGPEVVPFTWQPKFLSSSGCLLPECDGSRDAAPRRSGRRYLVGRRACPDGLRRGRRLVGMMRRVKHVGVHELQPGVGVLG